MDTIQITSDPSSDPDRQYKIDHAGKIDKESFKILVGFFTVFSTLAALLRIAFRLANRRKLYLDDCLVLFATACFLGASGVLFSYYGKIYMVEAIIRGIDVAFTRQEVESLMDLMKWNDAFLCLAWTTNFSIKFSFLTFFHSLIAHVSARLSRYYWFVVVFTALSGVFAILEPFILCPHLDIRRTSCPKRSTNIIIVTLLFVLDMTTDIMIVSIPMILLRMARLRRMQKFRIATFLCLSLLIVVVSLTRLVGGLYHSARGDYGFSMQWTFTILHVECAIAVLMGALSALRTVFSAQSQAQAASSEDSSGPMAFIYRKFNRLSDGQRGSVPRVADGDGSQPPMKGLGSFIRRYERGAGLDTVATMTSELEDYHQFKRNEKDETRFAERAGLPVRSPHADSDAPSKSSLDDDESCGTSPEPLSRQV